MRPVWYFRELEKKNRIAGQGDMREGTVFVEEKENQHYYLECFENSDFPIFCTYIIYDEDILDHSKILLDLILVCSYSNQCRQAGGGFIVSNCAKI